MGNSSFASDEHITLIIPYYCVSGHFTQVVWKESTELGVGVATDGNKVMVVGQYSPAGNMSNAGYFEKNVLPKGNN